MEAIGNIICKYRPMVIALQEVTIPIYNILRRQIWFQHYECSFPASSPRTEAYFVVLCSALPIISIEALHFPGSNMGRELLCAKISLGRGTSMVVGTSHLESMPGEESKRKEQFKYSLSHIKKEVQSTKGCIGGFFMGDMNFLGGELVDEDQRLADIHKFRVEKSPSGRAKCKDFQCGKPIIKDSLRIAKVSPSLRQGCFDETHYHHLNCFFENLCKDWCVPAKFIPGYGNLTLQQQFELQSAIGSKVDSELNNSKLSTVGLPAGWVDLWLCIPGNSNDNGITFDGKFNHLVSKTSYRSRLDRVYYFPKSQKTPVVIDLTDAENSSLSSCPQPNRREIHQKEQEALPLHNLQMSLVGTKPIVHTIQKSSKNLLWPSDHFGILSSFDIIFSLDKATDRESKTQNLNANVANKRNHTEISIVDTPYDTDDKVSE